MDRRPAIAALLALAVLLSTVAPALATGATTDGAAAAQAGAPGSVNVTVGQQLSTVVVEADSEVRTEVEEADFEHRFSAGDDDERSAAIAQRARELAQRAIAIREDYDNATRAHEAGRLSDDEYAARLASLNARAEDLAESVRRLRGHAAGVSALELRAEGVTAADLRAIEERLDAVTGTGAAALLERFTARRHGEIRIERRDGLSIEVEGEDGEFTREVERPRDGDANLTVSQGAALETARADLGTPPAGNWTLRRASVHEDDGYYRFRFALTGTPATGEAEVRVDGSSGEVVRLETEIEAPEHDDDDDDGEDDRERDDDRDELVLLVAEGTPAPNETVILLARGADGPVAGATVTLNGDVVGTTGENGTMAVTLPAGEADLRVEAGDAEGELEFEFREREDAAFRGSFDAGGRVADGTVTLHVTFEGQGVSGADVLVDDRRVGTTDRNGTATFDAAAVEGDELEVTLRKGRLAAELDFAVRDGALALQEADFEQDERESGEDRETDADEEDDVDRESGDDREDDETRDRDRLSGDLALEVVGGSAAPGATVTIAVTHDGEPVADAAVAVDGERVGTTGADGRISLTLPSAERVEVVAVRGDADGERRFEFEDAIETDAVDD